MLVEAGGVKIVSARPILLDADHVGAELPARGVRDSEVAVLHEAAEARLVHGVLRPAHAEGLLALAHRWFLRGLSGSPPHPSRCPGDRAEDRASASPRSRSRP